MPINNKPQSKIQTNGLHHTSSFTSKTIVAVHCVSALQESRLVQYIHYFQELKTSLKKTNQTYKRDTIFLFSSSVPASRSNIHMYKVLDVISPLHCHCCGSGRKGSSLCCWAAPRVKRWAFHLEQSWRSCCRDCWGCGTAWSGWKCVAPTAAPRSQLTTRSVPESVREATLPLCRRALGHQRKDRVIYEEKDVLQSLEI